MTTDKKTPASSRVLLIEDDLQMHELLAGLLLEDQIQLSSATSGNEAFGLLRENPVDLILLDLGLPGGMDGLDVLKTLKTEPLTHSIPVIVLTAWNSTEDKIRGFEL